MILSKARRARFLFRTEAGDRQFCWFEQRGDDLYFGSPSTETIEGATVELLGQSAKLTVPDRSNQEGGGRADQGVIPSLGPIPH